MTGSTFGEALVRLISYLIWNRSNTNFFPHEVEQNNPALIKTKISPPKWKINTATYLSSTYLKQVMLNNETSECQCDENATIVL